MELLESLLPGLKGNVDDGHGPRGQLRVAVVGQFDHLVADGRLNDGLDGLLIGDRRQNSVHQFVIALDLQDRGRREHSLDVELLGRELHLLELAGNVLNEDVVVNVSQQLNDGQALDFAVDHHDVLLAFNTGVLVVYVLTFLADLQHLSQNLFGQLFRVPETQIDCFPQETK